MLREDEASKSRKDRKCEECRRVIPAGTPHQLHVGTFEGDICEYRTCLVCVEIRNAFSCNGWNYGALWEDLGDSMDAINEGCFTKLHTVAAKLYLRERWLKWKGLA